MKKTFSLRDAARLTGLGKLVLYAYHNPVGRFRACWKEGGPLEQRRTHFGRLQMEEAAKTLQAPPAGSGLPLEPHLLTGKKFWYQTVFCLHSLALQSSRPLAPRIYDDGSLEKSHIDSILRLFPASRFTGLEEIVSHLDTHLPSTRFPSLRERWIHYPNIRKLTDIHAGRCGWKLVLDSDLLFFRRPDLLLAWCDKPEDPLHAVDVMESYGYSRSLMESLCGKTLAPRLNVGLCGLKSEEIDWEQLEFWTDQLIRNEQTNYFLEQALTAMLLAGRNCKIAPEHDYVTLPRPPESLECRAVMHHYVAESKRWYFQHNWKRVLD